jgi:hypothetical protein
MRYHGPLAHAHPRRRHPLPLVDNLLLQGVPGRALVPPRGPASGRVPRRGSQDREGGARPGACGGVIGGGVIARSDPGGVIGLWGGVTGGGVMGAE